MGWTVRGLNPGRGGTFRTRSVPKTSENINFIATVLESLISITDIFLQFHFNKRVPPQNIKANYY